MKSCLSRLIKNGNLIVNSNLIHNHNADEKKLNRLLLRNLCKKNPKTSLIVQLKLYILKLQKNSFNTLDYVDVILIRNRMYPCRIIQRNIPKKYC